MRFKRTKAAEPVPGLESKAPKLGFVERFSEWNTQHPILTIILISLFTVVVNCYPVIFSGKSFVSPTGGTAMVYDRWPPLAGMSDIQPVWQHGSDTTAMLLWGIPAGYIESRSVLDHGEFPLWNRYSHAGDTLIGQAVSMLGDPLQLIVIVGRGSAEAWDVKFLAAKFLFCVGFGLLILRLIGNRPLSYTYAALAAYCGAFFYINNHPAFFVFCYAPWIILSALALLDLRSERYVGWGLVWLLVNFACFNAGHVEVSVVLIGGLNLGALACALTRCRSFGDSARVMGRMAVGTLLFLGLAAPVWMSFLAALDGSYSAHSEIRVAQLPFSILPGLFDDLFYLYFKPETGLASFAPGTSLLIGVGCFFSALRWRQLKSEPFFWINGCAILLWGGCIYGWIPASVLREIPLLNRVGQVYTNFSYLLVVHVTIQSAYGFKCLMLEKDIRRAAMDFLWVGLILAGLGMMYCFGISHYLLPWDYFLTVAAAAVGAPLLFVYLKNRYRRIPAFGWLGIIILGFIPHFRFGLYGFGTNMLLRPGPRITLNAPSKSVDKIKLDTSGPFRIVGQGWNFFGDYSAVYGLEDIRSCAPLSNAEFIDLIRKTPGVEFNRDWIMKIMDPFKAQPLLNLLNVKYVLFSTSIEPSDGIDFRVVDRSDFCVLENLDVWPRAFFSDEVVSISSNEDFIKHLMENGRHPFIALAPSEIEKQSGIRQLGTLKQPVVSPATNYQLLPNSTAFDVHAPSAGIVCLMEGQARDFTAKVNKETRAVLTVNRAFKGVYVDKPGDYHVEFIYRPAHWRFACTLFGTALAVVLVIASISSRIRLPEVRRKNCIERT
jgi:hypothetical protein